MKILLAATQPPDILGIIGRYCQKALIQLGHEVSFFDFQAGRHLAGPVASLGKAKLRPFFSWRKISFINQLEVRKMTQELLALVKQTQPDILLVINGEPIAYDTIAEIRKLGIVTIDWFVDSLVFPYHRQIVESVSGAYDYFFMIDSLEVRKLVNISSKRVFWLPLACDPEVHKRLDLSEGEKKIYSCEVCFLGTVVPVRQRILETLLDFNLKIWGPSTNIYGSWLKRNSALKKCYQGRADWSEEMVKIYNASKIILEINSHRGKPIYSTTMRCFEVGGCGGFLLADQSPVLPQLYRIGEELVCYREEKELYEFIRHYLDNPSERQTITEKCHQRTYKEHTYVHRMSQMLELMRQ
ncbi:MAG: glycosyltransferase [Candidatus Omnitrophota bacterium]|nr:glycosyltransferase [Candidatus Omnitrophota bacterium]